MSEITVSGNEITALDLALGIRKIYEGFEESIHALGGKKKGRKMVGSLAHWVAGSHVRTERDVICDKFLEDVQSHLEMFDYSLEGLDENSVQEACGALIDICTEPVPADSNGTISLMKRAMISQVRKYLPMLSQEKLRQTGERLEKAYTKWQRLPVEKEVLQEIAGLLG
ncbi:MAG: hypothetical protein HUJ76_11525 [Parasporobacterium sp.]|nr:hypothetical protein [Parasporobacterium sp.]